MVMRKPGPVLAWFYHAPSYLYRAHLGRLMGPRFLMLATPGRRTGRVRRTVIEVVARRPAADASAPPTLWVVASRGPRTDWYANAKAARRVRVDWMAHRFTAEARTLDRDERYELLADYQRRHPKAAAMLGRAALDAEFTGEPEHLRALAATLRSLRLDPVTATTGPDVASSR